MKFHTGYFSIFLSILLLLSCLLASKSGAQTGATGFVRNYNAVQTVPDHDLLIGRNRVRLDLDRSLSSGIIVVSNEVQNFYSHAIDSLSYRLREAYVELYFDRSDLRLGRQIISWGRTDGAFITDVISPVDLSEFLTQDFADIRTGIDALSYLRYFGSNYLQLVINPVFNPNTTPRPGSRWFPRDFFSGEVPIRFERFERQPTVKDAQIGGRLALRTSLKYDLDLGVLYWHYPNPGYSKNFTNTPQEDGSLQLSETFTQSLVLMYSGTLQLTSNLLLKSETAFYTTRSFDYLTDELRSINYSDPTPQEQALLAQAFDNNTDGFLKDRPWLIGMAGLEYNLKGWTIGAQLIDEFIFDHDDQILQKQHYTYTTLLLKRSFFRDKLDFRGFGRYNIDGEDFWFNPELTYTGIDNFEASLGTQLFGGPETDQFYGHLSFDKYSQNCFIYLQLTGYF